MKYHFESQEYFYYHLYSKSSEQIREFYPKKHQSNLYFTINPKSAFSLANDKYASFLRFKEYYKRDICAYDPKTGLVDVFDVFEQFAENHPIFIVKPLSANCGTGIRIVEAKDYRSVQDLFETLKNGYLQGFIAEELVVQVQEMGKFHPKSVNTIRINSFRKGNNVELKFPCMRIGRGKSVVDNAGAGGVFGGIDIATGKLIAVGDEFGRHYECHPDTGIAFEGFAVPRWNELCNLAIEIADKFKECKIIGFDFALTEKGWVLIEINAHPILLFQIATQKGINKEMIDYQESIGYSQKYKRYENNDSNSLLLS